MRKRISIVAVVLVVLVAGGAIAVRGLLPAERVRRMAEDAASRAFGLPVTMADARVSFFPLGATVRGLRVENREPGAPPLLELREARASVRFLPLLSRRIEVSRVRAAGARVTILVGPNAPGSAPGEGSLEAGKPGPSPFALLVPSLEIEDCAVRVLDTALGTEVVLDSVTASSSVRVAAAGGPVDVRAGVGIGRARATQLASIGLPGGIAGIEVGCDLAYRPNDGTADVRELRISAGKLAIGLKGEVAGLPGAPRGTLTVATPSVEVGDLLSLLPAERAGEFQGSGPLSVGGEVRFGPGGVLAYRLAFALEGIDIRNARFPGSVEECRGKIEATERGIAIENLTARFAGKPLSVSGTVTNLADPVLDLSVQGEVDLGALAAAGLLPAKMAAGGTVRLDIRGSGPAKRRGDLSLEGDVRLEGVEVALDRPPVRVEDGRGSVRLFGKSAEAIAFDCIFNHSSTNITGSVRDLFGVPAFAIDLRTRKVDLNAFLPPPEEGEGAAAPGEIPIVLPPLPPARIAGRVRADTLLTGPNVLTGVDAALDLAGGKGTIRLGLGHASFGGVHVRGARSDLRLEGGRLSGSMSADSAIAYRVPLVSIRGEIAFAPPGDLSLSGLAAQVYRGTVSGGAHVTLGGPGRTAYRFEARAENLEANDFLSNLTPVRDVLFGGLDLESTWEGKGLTREELLASLAASGVLKARNGEIRNLEFLHRVSEALGLRKMESVRFREMFSGFSIAEGRVHVDDLRIAATDADWNIAGSVGFDGTLDYDVSVTLSDEASEAYRRKTALAGLLADESGRIVLDFELRGNAREPVVTYDASKTAARAGVRDAADLVRKLGGVEKVKGALGDLLGGREEKPEASDTAGAK